MLQAFRAQGIPVIVLKGAYLATAVYKQVALRPMLDIDLLVPRSDLYRAAAVVQQMGYEPLEPIGHGELISHYLPRFLHPSRSALELHWTIVQANTSYSIDETLLWQSAQQIVFLGISTKVLALPDIVLHLCIHATYHHLLEQGIRFLCDITLTLQRYETELKWDELVTRTQTFGWAPGVHMALYLAHNLMQAPVPATVLAQLQPGDFNQQIVDTMQRRLFSEEPAAYQPLREFSRFWENPSRWEQARLLLRSCFPAPAVMAQLYGVKPSPYLYLWYFHRLWDVTRRYRGVVWQRLRGDAELTAVTKDNQTLLRWFKG